MKVIHNKYTNIAINEPLTITIGNFDGLHIGHQNLIAKTLLYKDTKSALMTFDPHPLNVVGKVKVATLTTDYDKEQLVAKFNLDYYISVRFDKEFASLSVAGFIEFLKSLNVKRIIVGRDFRFGFQGRGSVSDLKDHFTLVVAADFLYQQTRVSSSLVKQMLDSGKMEVVKALLGRNFMISGKVIHGDKVGRTLGFPTANIDYNDYYLPKNGVYYAVVLIGNKKYPGVLNLGHNPTINYSATKRVEVFILNYDNKLYDQTVKISFIKYLREEKKFDSVSDLLEQINSDVIQVQKMVAINKNVLK